MKIVILKNSFDSADQNLLFDSQIYRVMDDSLYIRVWDTKQDSVIMGRFQNPAYEVNEDYIRKNNIFLTRRFTGGGTVFLDYNTPVLSLSLPNKIFYPVPREKMDVPGPFNLSLDKKAGIITEIISSIIYDIWKINTYQGKGHSLFHNGYKILGCAMAYNSARFFYHASLLYGTNLEKLNNSLLKKYNSNNKPDSRFVKSIHSKVTSIGTILKSTRAGYTDYQPEVKIGSSPRLFPLKGYETERAELNNRLADFLAVYLENFFTGYKAVPFEDKILKEKKLKQIEKGEVYYV